MDGINSTLILKKKELKIDQWKRNKLKQRGRKYWEKKDESFNDVWDSVNPSNTCVTYVPKRQKREKIGQK